MVILMQFKAIPFLPFDTRVKSTVKIILIEVTVDAESLLYHSKET